MMRFLRAVLSKIAAVGLLAGIGYGFVALAVQPVANHHMSLEEDIERQRTLLGRLLEAATEAKTGGAIQPSQLTAAGPVFLDGESDAIRVSSLQSLLGDAAQRIGARLSSTQAVPPQDASGVRLVGVQTQFTTTLERLQQLLHDLEGSRPLLIVDSLHIQRGPEREGQDTDDLDVRLAVLGAAKPVRSAP